MPHLRARHIEAPISQLARLSPLVGVLGHRQVGKTTLLEQISKKYVSFDEEDNLIEAQSNPKKFLNSLGTIGTGIDECQLAEAIFPALKEKIRTDKRPGQYYLSGSIRFTSKEIIRESLTGRIMTIDLLPLTLSELDRHPLPEWLTLALRSKKFSDLSWPALDTRKYERRNKLIQQYLVQGGLPGVCFIRNDRMRAQKIIDQLETILNRDLRQIIRTTLQPRDIMKFVRQLAFLDGNMTEYQSIKRQTELSPITQKKLLYALESVFVLRTISVEGDYRGFAIFFEDQGEVQTLSQGRLSPEQTWRSLIYRNAREQWLYRFEKDCEFFQYRTRGGAFVPFAIRAPNGTLGIIPVLGPATRSARASADSFLRKYPDSKILIITDQNDSRIIDERVGVVSAGAALWD